MHMVHVELAKVYAGHGPKMYGIFLHINRLMVGNNLYVLFVGRNLSSKEIPVEGGEYRHGCMCVSFVT